MADLMSELREQERNYPSLIHGPLCGRAADDIAWLRDAIEDACKVFDRYDLPEHALHYRRALVRRAALTGNREGEK